MNGNLTSDILNGQHTGYTYDDEDRLTSVTLPDGHVDRFTYKGLGMRLTKSGFTKERALCYKTWRTFLLCVILKQAA